MTALVVVGRISGVFGVQGWLKVFSYTQPKQNIFKYTPWHINGQAYQIESAQSHGKGLIAKLHGCDERDAVQALLDANIAVARDQLPRLPKDEYYWADLLGLQVINRQGVALGAVVNLLETGAHDVLVVGEEPQYLIPYVPEHFILSVDLDAGTIEVDWESDF